MLDLNLDLQPSGMSSAIRHANYGGKGRYFTELSSAAQQYYELSSPITLSGDFEIDITFNTTVDSNQILMGDNNNSTYYFNLSISNFSVWVAGTEYLFNHTAYDPQDGKLHTVKYKLVGTTLEVFLDGNSLGSQIIVPYTGPNLFRIGEDVGPVNSYWDGIIANVRIDNNGTEVVNIPFNTDLSSSVIPNLAATLGSDISNGTTSFPADTNVTAATGSVAGRSYLVNISGLSTSENFFFSGPGGNVAVNNGEMILVAAGSGMTFRSVGVSETGVTISVREIPSTTPYATAMNLSSSDAEFYTQEFSSTRNGYYSSGSERLPLGYYASGAYDRYFTELSSAASQSYELSSEVSLDDNYSVDISFVWDGSTFQNLIGGTGTRWNIDSAGQVSTLDASGGTHITSGSIVAGQLSTISISRTGTTRSIQINSETPETFTCTTDSIPISLIGTKNGTVGGTLSPWNNIISDLIIRDSGTTVVDILFNTDLSSEVISNSSATLGLTTEFTPYQVVGDWVNNGDGSFTYTGASNEAVLDNTTVDGENYLVNFTISGATQGELQWKPGSGTTTSAFQGNGTFQTIVQSDSVGIRFTSGFNSGRFDGTVSDISYQLIPATTPYATTVNLSSADATFYEYNRASNWNNSTWPNLLEYSEQFDNSIWTKSGATVTSNTDIGLDGLLSADTITDDSVSTREHINQQLVGIESGTYTASIFIKKDEDETRFPFFNLFSNGSGFHGIRLNTKTGAYHRTGSSGADDIIVQDCNDYWRLIWQLGQDSTQANIRIFPADSLTLTGSNSVSATGSVTVWGAHFSTGTSIPLYKTTTNNAGKSLEEH